MVDDDDWTGLSIGAVLGDSDSGSRAWQSPIGELGNEVEKASANVHTPLSLNVVFFTDGRLLPLEFSGVRTGRFSRKSSKLMIQAAIPPGRADERGDILIKLLKGAIDEAEVFARRRKVADNLSELRALVDSLTLR